MTELYHRGYPYEETCQLLKPVWDNNCTCILAIMDKRVGKRTLAKIKNEQKYEDYLEWVKQFYKLRFSASMKDGIMHERIVK